MQTCKITDIQIPAEFGTVTDRIDGDPQSPLLIHISDAHCNGQVQRNIAAMGRYLVDGHGFKLFAVEGTPGPIDVSMYRYSDRLKAEAERNLETGKITGPEWLAISHPKKLILHGIEDADVYRQNHLAMVAVLREANPAKAWISRLRGALLGLPGTTEMWNRHRLLGILVEGADLRLLRENYVKHSTALSELNLTASMEAIGACSKKVADDLRPGLPQAQRLVDGILAFYNTAVLRDGILFDKTLKALVKYSAQQAVVVTGGFHVGGLIELSRARGLRAVFIRPQITWSFIKNEEKKYLDIMMRQKP